MRDLRYILKPGYQDSWALIVGINEYRHVNNLSHATNDANAIAALLENKFGFHKDRITLLLDADATRSGIMRAFMKHRAMTLDDRLLFFFAGHGHTYNGSRGEVGYLVPHDGLTEDPSSLVRWEELTKGAELIPAKHVLFVMDACYGGLAVQRGSPGKARFLNDMYLRFSRQVLTAGKANEPVADGGGPIPGHSLFTGHFIEGLNGGAATSDGVITASGVMAYVYNNVACDKNSEQTPHYGHIEGDGDFVFQAMPSDALSGTGDDHMWVEPYAASAVDEFRGIKSKVSRTKELLDRSESSIQLHDFVTEEVRRFLSLTSHDSFSVSIPYSQEELASRIDRYQQSCGDLISVLACLSYWNSSQSHHQVLRKSLLRSVDRLEITGGLTVWIDLRWYPLILLCYAAGISAIESNRFDSLRAILLPLISDENSARDKMTIAETLGASISAMNQRDLFKQLPGLERLYTPMSEHLYKHLQPPLEEALFLGKSYEEAFDNFEILLALTVADCRRASGGNPWGPIGRFGWKYRRHNSPFLSFVSHAKEQGDDWIALQNGFFGGSAQRFLETADAYQKNVLDRLSWF